MATTTAGNTTVHLTDADYELLRGATETYREELLVRLCGEVGLRATEIPRLRPRDLVRYGDGERGYFASVHNVPTGGDEDDVTREAYVPSGVAHDFWQFVRSNDVREDESVIAVSARRIQMLVKAVASRAADEHDRPGLAEVTPTALRRLFARRLLMVNGVDPNVVCAVGGWERIDGLITPLEAPPREEIAEAFETANSGGHSRSGGRLATVIETMERVGNAVTDAVSPGAVRQQVCERLVAGEAYDAAWLIEREHHRDRTTVRAHAGDSPDRFEGANDSSLVTQVFQTGALMVAPDRPGAAGDQPGRGMLAAIPVSHGETDFGVLVLRSTQRAVFEKPERTALSDLGRRIGFAITAAKRRHLLSGESVVRLAVGYNDRNAVFVDLSASQGCSIELEGVVPAEAGALVSFIRAEGATPGAVLEHVSAHDTVASARLIRSYEMEALLEVVLTDASPAAIFTGHGGTIVEQSVTDGRAEMVGEFPPGLEVRTVIRAVASKYPSVELHSKQERAEPAETGLGLKRALEDELTDKQRSVLRGAYHAGYFEWPRGSTAEELAESMGVSSPTLHNHLRRAQQKLVGTALDDD